MVDHPDSFVDPHVNLGKGENMKKFENVAAQGDILFRRVDIIPEKAVLVEKAMDELIVTHSEMGYHHFMSLRDEGGILNVQMYNDPHHPLLSWLKVNLPTVLEHKRPFETHEPILFKKGLYEVRRQREYSASGWRQVQD